jgi:hypothetical protein
MAAFYWERHPSGPFVTLIAVAATYCSPEANPDGYECLRRLARRDDDHEMREFKAELRQALADRASSPRASFPTRSNTTTGATRGSYAASGTTCTPTSS